MKSVYRLFDLDLSKIQLIPLAAAIALRMLDHLAGWLAAKGMSKSDVDISYKANIDKVRDSKYGLLIYVSLSISYTAPKLIKKSF